MKKNDAQGVSARPVGRLLALPMALAMIGVVPAAQAANFACNWNANANGSWLTSALWSSCNSTHPNNGGGNTYDATINTGPYTVDLSTPVSIGTLTISQNTLNNSSTLTTSGGVVMNDYGGTLLGGTYVGSGGTAVSVAAYSLGTLDNVTLHGNLDLSATAATAYVVNGLAVKDSGGTNPGVINVTGNNAWLQTDGTQTLDGATVHLGGAAGVGSIYSGGGTLTLGSNLQVLADGVSASAYVYGGTIVNDGSMAFSNGASNNIFPSEFTNNGTITVAPATALGIGATTLSNSAMASITGADGSFIQFGLEAASNAGTITMNGAGGTTILQMGYASNPGNNPAYQWTNSGTINVTDTDLRLGGYFTQADAGTVNRTGGTVSLNGFLENTGQTLDISASSPLDGLRMAGGTIHRGTVLGNAATNLFATDYSSGLLDGVTVHGDLDVTGTGATVLFANGLSVKDVSGNNPGVINVTGVGAYLYSQGTQTLDNATVHLGGSSSVGFIYSEGGTLTLGANLQVVSDGVGSEGQLYGGPIVNEGSMAFSNGHYSNYINPSEFTNKGTITVDAATTLYIQANTLTNAAAGSITGADGSSIQFGSGTATNAGTITMNGAGGTTVLQMGYASNAGNDPGYQWTNTGTIDVTDTDLRLGGYFTQADVGAINRTGGTVSLNGFLENTGQTLDISASSPLDGLRMAGGTIHRGTVLGNAAANLFATDYSYGTLDGVTVHGDVDVTGYGANALFANGLIVKDSSGSNPGVINVTGAGAYLYSQGTQTLDNATVHLGGNSSVGFIYSESGTLTLGPDLHVLADGVGSFGQLYGGPIVNEGSMAFTNGHYNNQINPSAFTNKGTITVDSATALYIVPTTLNNTASGSITGADGSFIQFGSAAATNAGTITMNGAGGTTMLQMGYAGNPGNEPYYQWTNTGTIKVTDTDLRLGGYFTQADIGTVNRTGGTVSLNGFLENTGQTLDISASSPLDGLRMAGGTIHRGTVRGNAAANLYATDNSSGWLDGVTVHGDLDVTGANAIAYFTNGLSVKDSSGSNPGVIKVTGDGAYLYSQGTQTLDKATVHLGGTSSSYLYTESGTLTLGANLQVLADGDNSSYAFIHGSSIVNNGSMAFSNGSASNYIVPSEFTNNGTISSSNGSVVHIQPATLTNLAASTLTGGSYQAYAGSEIVLQSSTSSPVTTLAADVVLSGAGSLLRTYNWVSGTHAALEDSLTTITAAGALHVLANRDYTTAKAINNQGTLELGGGSFSAPSLANAGTLRGFGSVVPAIVNSGLVRASGGTLVAQAGVNGSGNIQVDGGATLDLSSAAGASSAQRLTMDGALKLGGQNIVVSKDYSNANFGSGNSFNRRNNATGAGQIVGQNAAQTVVGQVVNAGANTFTVDLGNVRGGTTANKTFQVQNSGSGADIRGAVQSAGTGNVTDGRLAVTTGNFGPLAVAAKSGDYTISFSASSGGALVGQKAGVVSNFDNVATQTINIDGFASVLAQGSATPSDDPVNLGKFRVGFTPPPVPTQNFDVSNLTSGSGAERLGIGSAGTSGNFAATNNLGANLIAPGGQQAAAVTAAVNNGVAGINNGAVTIQYTTNGQLIDALFVTQNANAQTINLQATGYNVAVGSATPTPVVLANQRVGGMQSQVLTVANTAAAGAFTEKLNASFGSNTGNALNNGGVVSLLAAGDPGSTAMTARVDTSASGARSGSVTLNYQTDGTDTSGLAAASAGSQVINVSGNVYQLASGQINSSPLNFGTVQVGQSVSRVLSISNTASGATGFVEDLNAAFGASSGTGSSLISGSGSISGLIAGATNASGMTVSVDTGAAATVNGAIAVSFASAGAVGGTSNGLGTFALGSVDYGVQGEIETQVNIINRASPVINNSPIALGNVRIGATSPTALVSVSNQATTAPQAALNATISGNGPIDAGGSFNLLNPGGTNNTDLQVGMNTASAGAINGTATIAFVSDASNVGGCAPNCQLNLPSQDVTVTGGVYQIAQANLPADVDLGNFRLGSAASQAINITNTNVAPAGFQEGLDASVGGSSGKATASGGPISNLAQGGSSNAVSVGIDNATATAGANNGTVTIKLASNGSSTSGLATMTLSDATINVSGTGYNAAVGKATPTPVVLANQRVGGMQSQVLTVANTATAGAFTEKLNASFGSDSGHAINNGGAVSLLAAGDPGSTAMSVRLDTSAAGTRGGSVTLNYQTDGTGSSGLGTASAGSQVINVSGDVYQAASGQINSLPLNFGTVQVGQAVSQILSISNTATGAAGFVEDLNASFGASSGIGSSLISGVGSINGLVASATNASGMTVSVDTSAAATVNGTIAVNFASAGAVGGTSNGLGTYDLGSVDYGVQGLIQANVINTASPVINNSPINLGNVRIGATSPTALVSVSNQATTAPQAALNATISGNGPIDAGGSFNLLNPGGTNNTDLQVGMNTASAGAINGTATIAFVSDASNVGGCAPNCQLSLPSQDVTVTGGVYQIAQANLPADVDLGNFRLGSAASQAINITNTNVAPAGFQEGLDASVGSSSGKATASGGPISNLAQGGSSNAVSVGIDNATATAGANNGTVTIKLASNGSSTSGLATMALSDATINVSGTGYNAAIGNATPTPVVLANQRVGGMQSQVLTVANTAAAGAFTEKLNASFGSDSGHAINNGGAVSLLAAGDPGSTAMSVRLDTSAAGTRGGSVTLNYQTDGTGSSGLGTASAGSQVINVSGDVYQAASGQINSLPLNFGTVQVGQAVSQILSISNAATGAAGFVEDLNASFGASSGIGSSLISGVGSINGLVASATNASGMTVSVDTSAAATVNGTIAVNFASAGAVGGTSNGLGTYDLGSVDYGVQGLIQANVINTASPVINNSPINLGNVRIGATSPTALVSVSNQATTAPQAALNATISGNGPIDAGGSFNLLNPGGTNNTDLQVGMNTASAGAINGTATIAFVSDASNVGGCAPNCQLSLPNQDVSVSGAVYRLANPLLNTTEVSLAARVGDAAPSAAISVTNSSPDIYTEGLKVSTGSAPVGFTNSGSIGNLAAGGTDASSLKLALDTSTAGSFSGSQTLAFKSTGAGTTDAVPDIDVGNGNVTVGGKVYTPAVATLNTASNVNFGIVHVGDSVSQAISVMNSAPVTELNDVLRGEFSSASAQFSGGGTLGAGLVAGATDSSSLSVGMNTAAAGNYSGSATFAMSSHDADLVDLALPDLSVSLSGTVNNYAKSIFTFGMGEGSFKADGNSFVLDFGTQLLGSGALKSTLYASNGAKGLADLLDGDFNFLDGIDFAEDGFDPFIGLGAAN
jgi:hypothetical protein